VIFADTTLAARIEHATCRMMIDSAESTTRRRPEANVFVRPIAGGVATYTGPGSPLNKIAGLGFAGPPDEAQLTEIERAYFERESAVQVELPVLGDPAIGAQLTRRGYVLVAHENVLGFALPADAIAATASDAVVTGCDESDFDAWLDVVVTGFASPDVQGVPSHETFGREVIERVVADMCAAPGFARYIAHRGGAVAGGASMCIGDGVAQMCGAATLPDHRRRGVQTAMLAKRLAEAAGLGCDLAVITTLPGSKSQQNAQRHGFELLYTRAILVREPPQPGDSGPIAV
jgi:GNAT superfamily N-acetyltransferase